MIPFDPKERSTRATRKVLLADLRKEIDTMKREEAISPALIRALETVYILLGRKN